MTRRTLTVGGKTYRLNRLYASGVGEQYFAEEVDTKTQAITRSALLTDESIGAQPEWRDVFEAARRAYFSGTVFNAPINGFPTDELRTETQPEPKR